MTDYPPVKKKPLDGSAKRLGSGTGTHKNRPLSGLRISPSLHNSEGSEKNAAGLNVKNFKGPNHSFPSIDNLVATVKPEEWNNIPLPVVDTITQILVCFLDLKKLTHDNWNEIMQTQHTANLI